MKLTKADTERIAEMVPGAEVTAEDDGIRIYRYEYRPGEMPIIGNIMRAACALELHPSQIIDNISYEAGTVYSEYTSDSDTATVDVTFRYEPI